nr:lipid-A-disaccharide synthase N-terminal domain-containing protein [uncultured Psychroserpens sp.]
MSHWWIYCIGFLAQLLFSYRLIAQWLASEQQQRVVTPTLFWSLSLIASILLFIYGFFRDDFSIMLGQSLTYYIYIRNLQLQKQWRKFSLGMRWIFICFPILLVFYFLLNKTISIDVLFHNTSIPFWLLLLGSIAQIVFVFRFVYQWLISEIKKTSTLPLGFWLLSLIGAILILIYAIIRKDWVLIIGHSFGSLIYIRNIILIYKKN